MTTLTDKAEEPAGGDAPHRKVGGVDNNNPITEAHFHWGDRTLACEVRIVGVGSPFGEDRVGWQAACYLEKQLEQRNPGTVQRCDLLDRPGSVLLDYLKPGSGVVLLLDAIVARPGMAKVATYALDELAEEQGVSSHGFGVAETLALGKTLGLLHPQIYVLGIATGSDAWQEPLIAEVDALLG
jgi:hydrogenase maturation protease